MSQPRRRILCAELGEDTCQELTTLLEGRGHDVVTAQSVAHCLDLARQEKFDLFMLEDRTAERSTFELCKQLRVVKPETPILFFSRYDFPDARREALDAGAIAYLSKSDDLFDIVNTVNSILLRSQRPLSESGGLDVTPHSD